MGIFLHCSVSPDITQEEWEPVYNESLRMAKAFGLMEVVAKEKYGTKVRCCVGVEDRAFPHSWGETEWGWDAEGDLDSMHRAEDQFTPKVINKEPREYQDPLLGMLSYRLDDIKDIKNQSISFWGNKTQGEPYHMALLAIAAMMETRLGDKFTVDGDITLGQCRKATELANKCTDKPVEMSVRCRLDALFERVRKMPLDEKTQIEGLKTLYLGNMDRAFYDFLRSHLPQETMVAYWKDLLTQNKVGTWGYVDEMRTFLNAGGSLKKLVEYTFSGKDFEESQSAQKEDGEGKGQTEAQENPYEAFVQQLMETHVYEDGTAKKDHVGIDRESERPYGVWQLLAGFVSGGINSHDMDVVIPLDEIRYVLTETLGEKCDVNGLIDGFLEREEAKKKETVSDLRDGINSRYEKVKEQHQKEAEEYDITRFDDLIYYEKGDRLSPNLESNVKKFFEFYDFLCEEERYTKLVSEGADACCRFICKEARRTVICLTEAQWDKMFESIQADVKNFRRFYPAVRVEGNDTSYWILLAVITNDEFYEYARELSQDK